jgi:alpha-1,3-rhamnosyl/mannosyltransferase
VSLRVILNVDAISAPLTGIGRYALELARGLAIHPDIEALRLYSACRWVDDPAHALAANRNIARLRRALPLRTLALEGYALLRGGLFRAHTRRLGGWLQHSPNYVLLPFAGPSVATIHDLTWLRFPDTQPIETVRFLERHLPRTLEQATRILTVSSFVGEEIVSRLGVARGKIDVIPLGVGAEFHPRTAEELRPVLARHQLVAGAYLLVVATQEPRKNLAGLVRAYAGLPSPLRARQPLTIVGARGWLNAELDRTLAPLESAGTVRRLGYVAEDELPLIYAGAGAFAFPSLYEGFGLPLLEAMASGVPALTSNVASLPEVGGDVALGVDPEDIDALRAGLVRLLEDERWRAAVRPAGIARARGFTWSRCVDATVASYRDCIA